MSVGISGKILDAIQSLYENVQCTVKVNDLFSPWFPVTNGVKQGCKISPTLFSIYIHDLAEEIKRLNCGVNLDDTIVSVFLYADDIVLTAPTAENLQMMLDALNSWCRKWKLTVNQEKTKVIHFRTASVNRSTFDFKCGDKDIEYTSS